MQGMAQAGFWIAVYLAAVLAPLGLLLVAPTPRGGGFWWDVAMGFGFAGLAMMAVQFLLTARFRRATAPFGIDVVYYFHRYLAYVLVAVLVAHPVVLILINPAQRMYLNPLEAPWEMTAGSLSLLSLLALIVSSAWRKNLGIPYDGWRVVHLILAVAAMALGFYHMWAIGYYSGTPVVRVVWALIGLSVLAVVFRVRLLRPWSLLQRPFRVTEVREERGDSWTLAMEPVGHGGFAFEPGQFAWVTLGHSPFAMREHPFSIASSPVPDGRLEFTIKELGDFTRTVGQIEPGEPAYVDGPYGAFSLDRHPDAAGYTFIAGGIGVAPMASMLRALADREDPRSHILFAAHSDWERIPLRDEFQRLREHLDLEVVHVLEEPPEDWSGETGWITREVLDRHLPENRDEMEYFICGPIPMIQKVEGFLDELGIPASRVRTELFDLA